MVEHDDKYADEEENLTQVRSIIKKLNEDKPSQERTREVVVRADGSKVVRVTKKRRVLRTAADKRRQTRRQVLLSIAAVFLLLLAGAGYMMFRMVTMSSSAYLELKRTELQQLWGATSVQIEGAGLDGVSLKLQNVVADFPAGGMLQRVELSGVSADLELMSYITGELRGNNLSIDRVQIVLNNDVQMQMPVQNGDDIWKFRRVECKDFSVQYANQDMAPIGLQNTHAYMYYPSATSNSSVVMLKGGVLDIRGWKKVRVNEAKAHISQKGIDDFSLSGTTDAVSDEVEQRRTSIAFAGKMPQGSTLSGPFAVEADNMSLSDFTEGRFEQFFTARTMAISHGKVNGKFKMNLSATGSPVFSGELHLKNIGVSSFPALTAITEHIEYAKRRLYNPLSLNRGYVNLGHEGGSRMLEIPEGGLVERDLVALSGRMVLNEANELSGEMSYGIPMVLARVEYPDGQPDPIFRQNGEWAVLSTNLKGRGNLPGDDMAEVEARAAIARRDRPERIPFDELDVNKLTNQLLNQNGNQDATYQIQTQEQPVTIPAASQQGPQTIQPENSSYSNPFDTTEDVFAPSTPF